MKKKTLKLIPVLLLTGVALVGCQNGNNPSSSTSGGTSQTSATPTTGPTTGTSVTSGTSASTGTSTSTGTTSITSVFRITFMNETDVFEEYQLYEGEQIVPPQTNPTKDKDESYEYNFIGWSEDGISIVTEFPLATEDKLYTAAYDAVPIVYTISFMNEGSLYQQNYFFAGEQIVPPEDNPTKDSDLRCSYTFAGWSEDGYNVISQFPVASKDKTYVALYEANPITYTATIHFDYLGGPDDVEVTYNYLDDLVEKANEVKSYLPKEDIDYVYEWENPIPDELPLENQLYTVKAVSKYFTVDMSSTEVDEHLEFIKRSSEDVESSMTMDNGAIKIVTTNDHFIVDNKYTNFDLSFKMKINNNDRFVLVLGTDLDNMKLSHTTDNDINAVGGVVGMTLVPSHANTLIRLNSETGVEQRHNPLHVDTNIGFNKGDGVNVRVRMRSYKCEIFFNDNIVDAITFTSEQYTPGKQIGFAFSNSSIVTISEFAINEFNDTSFSHKMETLGRATEQLIGYQGAISYNGTTKALDFDAQGHTKMYSFHQISSNFKFVANIKFSGAAQTDRIDLIFGMQESDLFSSYAGGAHNSHEEHPGVMNALIVPNHATSNVRLFYNGLAENQFATKADKVDISTTFVKLEVSCFEGVFTFKINDQINNTYELPDNDFPERGYFGISSGINAGTISITDISVVDLYIPEI